jgi:3-dehydroquinate synthase
MDHLQQNFSVRFEYKVFFTDDIFNPTNQIFREFLLSQETGALKKLLFAVDSGVLDHHPQLPKQIKSYLEKVPGFSLVPEIITIPGGEAAKNDDGLFYKLVEAVDKYGIDRHSYMVAIGGGSVLDLVGYAAAVSHRGIRHIRIPTTVLSQNDSGVGVKNGINHLGKKNFLGTFAPPAAVFNDFHFLTTLSDAEWRSGTSEAVKVALIKDKTFYDWLVQNANAISARDEKTMKYLIWRCAQMHLGHIAGGDPFEMGSSRPLDFGHWSAHKVEQLSNFSIRHGEAVAMGIALDSAYSYVSGRISETETKNIIQLLTALGFNISHPLMEIKDENSAVLKGLNEFREHLGGRLTIMLLDAIGKGAEVNQLDTATLYKAGEWLKVFR